MDQYHCRPSHGQSWPLVVRVSILIVAWLLLGAVPAAHAQSSCSNPIVCENALPGNPASEWDITGAGDSRLQGFATDISVNRGETVYFKVATDARAYRLDIYRMGYYGGMG